MSAAPDRDAALRSGDGSEPQSLALPVLTSRGFAVVPSVVTGEPRSDLRSEAESLIERFESGHRSSDFWSFTSTRSGLEVLYRVHNLEQQDAPLAAALFASGPLHDLAAAILGRPAFARVAALIVKVPFHAAAVPWHRDRTDLPPGTAVNLSLFLDDSTADNGCLEFVPRSHLLADDADALEVSRQTPVVAVEAKAGDVAVHDVRVVHASRPNASGQPRRSIVMEFLPTRTEGA